MLARSDTALTIRLVLCPLLALAGACATPQDSSDSKAAAETQASKPRAVTHVRDPGVQAFEPPIRQASLRPVELSQAQMVTDGYNSARICGACHESIFRKWSRSMHALAYADPIFEAAFLKAYYYSGGEAARLCLGCHSPTVMETNDVLGKSELTQEGVTCDYCHSTAALVENGQGRLTHTIDHRKKYGPFEQPSPPDHEIENRAYFVRSEICASCHDYTLPDGTVVFATYSEWLASKYAKEGKQCQDCHMPRLEVSGDGKNSKRVVNDHDLQGGHSASQIKKALELRIEEATRDADRARIVVAVENSGAGHSVPTGLPSRMVVLTVTATQRRRPIFRREIVYQRVMQGEGHRALTEDWEIKLLSKRLLRDNRISSGEVRRETFVFEASPDEDIVVLARVSYRYQPKVATGQTMEVPITKFEKVIARGM